MSHFLHVFTLSIICIFFCNYLIPFCSNLKNTSYCIIHIVAIFCNLNCYVCVFIMYSNDIPFKFVTVILFWNLYLTCPMSAYVENRMNEVSERYVGHQNM